ncbi:hypothetical protein AYO71_07965 [Pseudomonas koreensis]|nr:hypothetical protein AYO71_07965 [Pseudomonas koreensis]
MSWPTLSYSFFAAIGVGYGDAAFVVPDVLRFHLRKVGPVTSAARQFAFVFPLPIERRAACQLPLENDVLVVVAIAFGFVCGILRLDQAMLRVVAVSDQRLHCVPCGLKIVRWQELLIVDGDDVLAIVPGKPGPTLAKNRPRQVVVKRADPYECTRSIVDFRLFCFKVSDMLKRIRRCNKLLSWK